MKSGKKSIFVETGPVSIPPTNANSEQHLARYLQHAIPARAIFGGQTLVGTTFAPFRLTPFLAITSPAYAEPISAASLSVPWA